jgi:hypothetical protein
VLTISMHCEASGAYLNVNRQHRAIGRERQTGFLNPVSKSWLPWGSGGAAFGLPPTWTVCAGRPEPPQHRMAGQWAIVSRAGSFCADQPLAAASW